jgi:uncharacterized protein DUF1538
MATAAQETRVRVTFGQAMGILLPYSWHHISEQIIVVVPVCIYLALFHLVVLKSSLTQVAWVTGGISLVILGLAFFLEGIRLGLVPLGDAIGNTLPRKAALPLVLTFAFFLGILGAFGEPVVGSLQIAGAGVDPAKAPLVYKLLVTSPIILKVTISLAVGVAVFLAVLRFVRGWSLKWVILPLVGTSIALTIAASRNHDLSSAIGLAWDTGAVIVGPVLCPLVLALGLGVCRAAGRADSGMAGFGTVGLISVMPIAMVIVLSFVLDSGGGIAAVTVHHAQEAAVSVSAVAMESLILSVRAIVPIFVFLYCVLRFWLKDTEIDVPALIVGVVFANIGLFLFNFGLSVGLGELGNQVGHRLPYTFHPADASIYPTDIGKVIVVIFGVILGYGATLAEPAFNVLGAQVEEVTQGAFKKWLFSQAVAIGVGVGAGLGMCSLIYQVDLLKLLLPPYILLFLLTLLNDEKYVNIAWDGGAVTTGPVTVPLKIAIGIALSHATGFAEGFGILALASAYPVLNILLLGLFVKYKQKKVEVAA